MSLRHLLLPFALVVSLLLPMDARASMSAPHLFPGVTTQLEPGSLASRLSLADAGSGGDVSPGNILIQTGASFGTSLLTAVGVLVGGAVLSPKGAFEGNASTWEMTDVLLFGAFALLVPAPSSAVTAWLVGGPGFGKRFGWAYLVSAAICTATLGFIAAVRPESVPAFYVFGLLAAAGGQVAMANRVSSSAMAVRLPEVRPTTALAESAPRVRSVTLVSMSF